MVEFDEVLEVCVKIFHNVSFVYPAEVVGKSWIQLGLNELKNHEGDCPHNC